MMKNWMLTLAIFPLMFLGQSNTQEVKIQTSAFCDMCEERIETVLLYSKGVQKADLNLEDKVVTITYHPKRTSPESLRELISKTGYDADDLKADEKSKGKLPMCCQVGH